MGYFKKFIVQVQVDCGDGACNIATGYPVAENVILTVDHVLRDFNGNCAVPRDCFVTWPFLGTKGDKGPKEILEILWSDKGLDAALLKVEFPTGEIIQCGQLSFNEMQFHTRWESRGFPRAGRLGEIDDSTDLCGECMSCTASDKVVELTITAAAKAEDWEGASGSPVMANGQLIAIVGSTNKAFQGGRFKATRTHALLQVEEFRAHVVAEIHDSSKQKLLNLQNNIAVLLRDQVLLDLVERALADSGWGAGNKTAKDVAVRLCHGVPRDEVTATLAGAHRACVSNGNYLLANQLCQVLRQVFVALFGAENASNVLALQASGQSMLLSLPVSSASIAEAVMAFADGRALEWSGCLAMAGGGNTLKGRFLVHQAPEDFSAAGQSAQDIVEDWSNATAVSLQAKFGPQLPNKADQERIDRLLNGFMQQAARGLSPRTYYFLAPLNCGEELKYELLRLNERFPRLVCILPEISESEEDHQLIAVSPIHELL